MTADRLPGQTQPSPQEIRSPNLQEQMEQLFKQIAIQFAETPQLEMDYYSQADFNSRFDKGKGWLDQVGSEPPVQSLQELLSLLKRVQNWHRPEDIRPPGALPYRVSADDPGCPKPESYKPNAQWWGDVRSIPANSDHSVYSLLKLFRDNPYIPDKQKGGQFVHNPHGVDLEIDYNSGGTFGENQTLPHLTIHNHVNGQRATFTPKLT